MKGSSYTIITIANIKSIICSLSYLLNLLHFKRSDVTMAPGTDIFLEPAVQKDDTLSSGTLFLEHNWLRSATVREKRLRQQNQLSAKSSPNDRD